MIVTTSWDDGHPLDLRVAELLARHGLPGTFYVPLASANGRLLTTPELRGLDAHGFEIGGHGWSHARLPGMAPGDLRHEVGDAKAELEQRLGHPVVAFCYPEGKHDRRARAAVAEAGFAGARGTARYRVRPSRDPWLWATSIQAHQFSAGAIARHLVVRWNPAAIPWWLAQGGESDWVRLSVGLLDWAEREDGIWHLWGHGWEVDAEGQWPALEEVLREAASRTSARRLTNGRLFADAHTGRP